VQDTLTIIFFGWPAILGSLLVTVVGLLAKKPLWIAIGGALLLPFSIYLTIHGVPGIILPLFPFGAAWAVARQKISLAWLLMLPLVIAIILLVFGASR
jgi:hypothetical protein